MTDGLLTVILVIIIIILLPMAFIVLSLFWAFGKEFLFPNLKKDKEKASDPVTPEQQLRYKQIHGEE